MALDLNIGSRSVETVLKPFERVEALQGEMSLPARINATHQYHAMQAREGVYMLVR